MNLQSVTHLILKVYGVIRLFDLIAVLPYHYYNLIDSFNHEENTLTLITGSIVIVELLVVWLLLVKTKIIVKWMGLQREELNYQVNITLGYQHLVKLTFIFLGIMLVVNTSIDFISTVIDYFESEVRYQGSTVKPNTETIILQAGQVGLGIILVAYHKALADWVIKMGNLPDNSGEQV